MIGTIHLPQLPDVTVSTGCSCPACHGALAQAAPLHYLEGLTSGHLARIMGLNKSPLIESQHRLAELQEPVLPRLLAEIRGAGGIFGDETTWRNNGDNGYAWMLKSVDTFVYAFRGTRASKVAKPSSGKTPTNSTTGQTTR